MPDVLKLKDESVHTLFEPKDFGWLIEKYMGWDAERFFNTLVERLTEAADKTMAEINTDLGSYESSLESNTTAFQEILEVLKEMKAILQGRTDKSIMFKLIDQLEKIISSQI